MTRRAIRTRRLLIAGLVLVIGVGTLLGLYLARNAARQNLVVEARAEGMSAYHAGDYDTALRRLSYFLRTDRQDVEALLAFADARSKVPAANNRHVPEAVQLYNAVLEHEPDNLEALSGLLLLYEQLRRHIEWLEIAERVLEQDPDNIDALRLSAIAYRINSQFERATAPVLRLIELEPHDIRWRSLRLALLREQDAPFDDILALCQTWADEYQGDGRYYLMMAQLLVTGGQLERARSTLVDAAELGASSPEVLRPMLSLMDVMQLRDVADDLVKATQRAFPDKQWPREAAVRRLWQVGRLQDALAEIDAAEQIHGSLDRELLRWRALLLVITGDVQPAETALVQLEESADADDGRERDTDRAWVRALRARLQADQANWSNVIDAYLAALALAGNDPVIHFLAGEAYARLGDFELATASFERAYRSDPNWHAAKLRYAEGLLHLGRARTAYDLLLEPVRRGDGGTRAYVLFARAWMDAGEASEELPGINDARTGRPIRLVDLLNRLHQAAPDSHDVREVLVQAALHYGHRDMAEQVIAQTLDERVSDSRLLVALAELSMRGGLGFEEDLIALATDLAGLTPEVASVRARIKQAGGDTAAALAVLDDLVHATRGSATMASAMRVQAGFLVEVGHRTAARALEELLEFDGQSPATAIFVLSQPVTWEHAGLAERAIDAIAASAGDDSTRVSLLRANYILRHRTDEPAELARAQSMMADALQSSPDSLAALSLMAQLLLTGDSPNINQAIRHLERAIAAHPGHADLYVRIIHLLQQQGNFTEADRYLNRLGHLAASRPELLRTEIELLERQGSFDRVVRRLSQTIDETSSELDQLMYFSRLHMTGRTREAEALLSNLLASPQRSHLTILLAAEFYANTGRFDDGLALIQSFEPDGGRAAKAVLVGRYYQHSHLFDKARAAYEEALGIDPDHLEALVYLAQLKAAMGDERGAYTIARRGLEKHPDNGDLQNLMLMAGVSLGERERSAAMRLVAESESVDRAMLDVAQLLGRVPGSTTEGRQPSREHLAEARRLVEVHPHFLPAWNLAVDLHLAIGRHDDAVRLARQAAARFPNRTEPARLAAQVLAQANRHAEALEMARTWRQRSLARPIEADLFIATMLLALDRPTDAAAQLAEHSDRLLAEHDRHPQRLGVWMYVQLRASRADAAIAKLRPLFDEIGTWRTAWLESIPLLDRAPARQAIEAIEPDLRSEPEWMLALGSTWSHFGSRFNDVTAFDRAEHYARLAGEAKEELRVSSLMIRAQNADWRGDEAFTREMLRSALSLDPENPIVLNNLADVLIRTGGSCDEAAELAMRASELAPGVPEIIDTRANAMLCLDDTAAAEHLVRKALAQRPGSPYFLATLGLVLATQERWDEATSTLHEIDRVVKENDVPTTRALQAKLDRLRHLVDVNSALSLRGSQ